VSGVFDTRGIHRHGGRSGGARPRGARGHGHRSPRRNQPQQLPRGLVHERHRHRGDHDGAIGQGTERILAAGLLLTAVGEAQQGVGELAAQAALPARPRQHRPGGGIGAGYGLGIGEGGGAGGGSGGYHGNRGEHRSQQSASDATATAKGDEAMEMGHGEKGGTVDGLNMAHGTQERLDHCQQKTGPNAMAVLGRLENSAEAKRDRDKRLTRGNSHPEM